MNHIGNIVLFGNKKSGKTELAKQMVYSIATDTLVEYRVLVFSDNDDYKCILNMPYINENHKIRFQILRIKELDYSYLKKRLLNKKYPMVFCVDNIDNYISEYGKNEKATNLIDFLHYVCEMSKAFEAYVMLIGENIKEAIEVEPIRRMVVNADKKFILKQSEEQINILKEMFKLSDDQVNKIKALKEYQSLMLS